MIKLETFSKHLNNPIDLRPVTLSYIGEQGKNIEQWRQSLTLISLEEQYDQLEKVLSEVLVANIADERRMQIMYDLQPILQRIVGQLHSEYVHEPNNLSSKQFMVVDQVKTIFYLCVLVHNGVLNRQIQIGQIKYDKPKLSFKTLISSGQAQNNLTQQSVYFLMQNYLYLLMEDALVFEKASDITWQQLNSLYLYSIQENIANAKMHHKHHEKHADTIHEYYLQACLYSLLKPASYRRQDILSVHKVINEWASKITIESNVNSDSKIFVDLNSKQAPEYLTPYSQVNPYDENNVCVFIYIDELLVHLEHLQDQNVPNFKPSFRLRLAKLAEYTLKQQQFKLRTETRHPARENAFTVVGLHRIHYQLSGRQPFGQLINKSKLPIAYHPKLRVSLDMSDYEQQTPIVILDRSTSGYRFKSSDTNVFVNDQQGGVTTPKFSSLLKVLSLFAISPDLKDPDSTWELGMVRWIDHQEIGIQAGARLVGYTLTACGIRLDTKDDRSQDFVPALLVAGNETLETKTSLILPQYHFRVDDKVVLRIGDKETKLRLSTNLQNTDDMQQYEIIRLHG